VQTANFMKKRKGYASAGCLYSTFWSNLSKNFTFGGPISLPLHQWGRNLAWRRGPWRKTSKSASEYIKDRRVALRTMLPVMKTQKMSKCLCRNQWHARLCLL